MKRINFLKQVGREVVIGKDLVTSDHCSAQLLALECAETLFLSLFPAF